jgi:hypothetical protein
MKNITMYILIAAMIAKQAIIDFANAAIVVLKKEENGSFTRKYEAATNAITVAMQRTKDYIGLTVKNDTVYLLSNTEIMVDCDNDDNYDNGKIFKLNLVKDFKKHNTRKLACVKFGERVYNWLIHNFL